MAMELPDYMIQSKRGASSNFNTKRMSLQLTNGLRNKEFKKSIKRSLKYEEMRNLRYQHQHAKASQQHKKHTFFSNIFTFF